MIPLRSAGRERGSRPTKPIGKPEQRFVSGKRWVGKLGTPPKREFLTLVERGGRSISIKVEMLNIPTVKAILDKHVAPESILNSDEAAWYRKAAAGAFAHETVNHGNAVRQRQIPSRVSLAYSSAE